MRGRMYQATPWTQATTSRIVTPSICISQCIKPPLGRKPQLKPTGRCAENPKMYQATPWTQATTRLPRYVSFTSQNVSSHPLDASHNRRAMKCPCATPGQCIKPPLGRKPQLIGVNIAARQEQMYQATPWTQATTCGRAHRYQATIQCIKPPLGRKPQPFHSLPRSPLFRGECIKPPLGRKPQHTWRWGWCHRQCIKPQQECSESVKGFKCIKPPLGRKPQRNVPGHTDNVGKMYQATPWTQATTQTAAWATSRIDNVSSHPLDASHN